MATSAEVGTSGLSYSLSGTVTEELHPNLQGKRALDTWREMKDNDALVGAILFAIDMLARQVEWGVEQGDSEKKDAEFLEECMDDMSQSWGDFISEVFSFVPFGFSFVELCYKKRNGPQKPDSKTPSSRFNDGKVGWRKLPLRAQETLDRWDFDDEGGVSAFVQRNPLTFLETPIPMAKGLLFRTSVYKNNPEGRSLLRHAYTSWYYKRRIQAIEGTGIERDLAGFPVFGLPAEYLAQDASDEQKAVVRAFETLGKNIRRDKQEYMIMPLAYDENGNKAYEFSLTASSGTRTFDLNGVIARYNKEIAMSVLADFILLGHEGVGSFALSSDKTNLFAVAMGTLLDAIADVMNRYAVPRLFELNGMNLENLPKITHQDIEKFDLTALGGFISTLSGAGMPLFPDEDLEDWLRKGSGMPEKSDETKRRQAEAKEDEDGGEDEYDDDEDGTGGASDGDGGPGQGTSNVQGPVDLAGL